MAHVGETTVIPRMTSNTTPSGIVSASSYNTTWNRYPWHAFINSNNSYWQSNSSNTGWIQYKFDNEKIIRKYTITPSDPRNAPKSWSFRGSNDGSDWTVLDSQINESTWEKNVKKEFEFQNVTPYTYYRISITAAAGGTSYPIQITYIEMMELVYDNKTLIHHNNEYKKYNNGWVSLSNTLTDQLFLTEGMDDASIIPESAWAELSGDIELCHWTDDPNKTEAQFTIETEPFTLEDEFAGQTIKIIEYTDNPNQTESRITLETEPFTLYDELGDEVDVLYYTDDPNKTSAELEINANYSPLDELDGDFEVVTWSDSDAPPLLHVEGVPFEQVVLPSSEQEIFGKLLSLILEENSNDSVGKLRVIMSFDGGRTWESNKYGKWLTIDHTNKDAIISHGMSPHDVSKLQEASFKGKGDKIRIGYLIADNIHLADGHTFLHNTKADVTSPTGTIKFSDVAFYILNTAATIQVEFAGNKLSGELSDDDLGKVQYKVSLNGNPYYPSSGHYTPLMNSPQAININISDRDILFGVYNTLRIDFQDAWGQQDYWETTFIGTYSGIMFMDENKNYLSNSFGEILKYLDFGVIIAGQTTLEQKVIVKNQIGYRVQNLLLEVVKEKLPEGVTIEMSRSNFPFIAEDPLLFNRFFNEDEEFEFYVRIVTELLAPPAPNGTFEIRAKADTV
ncbi:discoidin domain-containing protein [Paenibacillus lentus]|uniref:discoidin domain-containing protein n=1 Tax=Paenibacillus lentus TaxID=1338368 RepID=UPI003649467B